MVDRLIDGKRCNAERLVAEISEKDARKYAAALKDRPKDYDAASKLMESYCLNPSSDEDCHMVLSSLEERLGPIKSGEMSREEKRELSALKRKRIYLQLGNAFKPIKKPLIIAGSAIGIVGALFGSVRGIKELDDDSVFARDGINISDDYGLWGEAKFEYTPELHNEFYDTHERWEISYEKIRLIDYNNDGLVDKIMIGEYSFNSSEYLRNEENKNIFLEADRKYAEYCSLLNCNQRFQEWETMYRGDLSRPAQRNYVLKQLDQ